MVRLAKKIFVIIPAAIVGIPVLAVLMLFAFLTLVEYRPKPLEAVPFTSGTQKIEKGTPLSIISWNIGYAGLGKDEDFFMDGGSKVQPDSKEVSDKYFSGIKAALKEFPSDIIFIQEIDLKSKRSWKFNQYEALKDWCGKEGAFAYNYKCVFVPIPFPPIGYLESGISTLTNFETSSATRFSLPVPFKWPTRVAKIKRCLLVTRLPVYENDKTTNKELVLVNFHLEAYDDGEGKIEQTKVLKEFITEEYAKGNYVIAGGDFNQTFPNSNAFPIIAPEGWVPGKLDPAFLNEGWQLVYDDSNPTCRALDAPYNDEKAKAHNWQYHVIDGFIISPNVEKLSANTIDLDFQNSDHNPVRMSFALR